MNFSWKMFIFDFHDENHYITTISHICENLPEVEIKK